MNGPKLQLDLMARLLLLPKLAPAFRSGLICCWSVWRYIIIIRCTCNSYCIRL